MNDLVLNGTSLAQYGAIISAEGSWSSPERDITVIEIPGRSDPIMQDNGRWKPQKLKYRIGCVGGRNFDKIRAVLNSFVGGSIEVEDSYHPEEYRIAWFTGEITPAMQVNNHLLEATVEFTADARRWLKSGKLHADTTTGSLTLTNPTMFAAKPTIGITTTAGAETSISYNNATIVFPAESSAGYYMIDTDTMDLGFDSSGKIVRKFTVTNEKLLFLPANASTTITTTSSSMMVFPKWYTV